MNYLLLPAPPKRPWWKRLFRRQKLEIPSDQAIEVLKVLLQFQARATDTPCQAVIDSEPPVTLWTGRLEEGCVIETDSVTPALPGLLFELLRSADWILFTTDARAFSAKPLQLAGGRSRLRVAAKVCDSAEKLAELLIEADGLPERAFPDASGLAARNF